ncbi:MAG: 5'-methylthioadenosine/adenosylhomocysteine nucleosidase [Coriobacteriales bacterium]|nr:5'-methylthioadenosine/adenosylhomocysteine nucleosidase [Coriobacteriales bacterium]
MNNTSVRVGIIGAMDIEVTQLCEALEGVQEEHCLGMTFYTGTLDGVDVVAVQCGVGKVNAALCAGVLVTIFDVTHVINTGVAGALDARIDIGDIVVSTDAVQHDMDCTPLGYAAGRIPLMDNSVFCADEDLSLEAVYAVRKVAPTVSVYQGRIASGDQFVASAEQKERIVSQFGAMCGEMEGAAIAHACHLAKVPFVIIRSISDKADGAATMDYPTLKIEAAARSAAVVEYMVGHLGQ